jgi:hypothetical protein
MNSNEGSFLRKQAWDYFTTHASQRMSIFNFYIVLSSLIFTGYFTSFKDDAHLQSLRPSLAFLLCFLSFVFWKLDQRTSFLIKNAERALKYFEASDEGAPIVKVFTQECLDTETRTMKGWRRILFWHQHFTYSWCFKFVYISFSVVGAVGVFVWLTPLVPPIVKRIACSCTH